MKRGEIVLVALQGDAGKPRPAVIIQAETFNKTHATVLVCPMTATLQHAPAFRVPIDPSDENGLKARSEIMVDKIASVRREKLKRFIGKLDRRTLMALDDALSVFIGLDNP